MAMRMNRLRVAAAMAERSFYAQNRIATPILGLRFLSSVAPLAGLEMLFEICR